MKTQSVKESDIQKDWFVVDATDLSLGRLATQVAHVHAKTVKRHVPHSPSLTWSGLHPLPIPILIDIFEAQRAVELQRCFVIRFDLEVSLAGTGLRPCKCKRLRKPTTQPFASH